LSLAWVLQNSNVSAAIIGATKPSQIVENVQAAGVRLDADTMARIDAVLGPIVERDPGKIQQLAQRP
jgi:aryl-alcohol dehydrogenase-like predicted oxidoreductase